MTALITTSVIGSVRTVVTRTFDDEERAKRIFTREIDKMQRKCYSIKGIRIVEDSKSTFGIEWDDSNNDRCGRYIVMENYTEQ